MIGDGANDCEAINQADVGISFAGTEAAFSAPFSALSTSLSCICTIICFGKSSISNIYDIVKVYLMC
jgi:cation-transporting ATPase 13A3/4/5